MRRRARTAIGATLLAAVALLLVGSPAAAHTALIAASPADGATVTAAPDAVVLEFDESLLDLGRNAIGVTDPSGRQVVTACATVDGATLTAPIALTGSGAYRVSWRVTAADGHLIGDGYTFRYRAPAGAPAPPARAAPPSCTASAAAQPAPAAGIPTAVVVAIAVSGVALIAVAAVALLALLQVRRTDRAAAAAGNPGDAPRESDP